MKPLAFLFRQASEACFAHPVGVCTINCSDQRQRRTCVMNRHRSALAGDRDFVALDSRNFHPCNAFQVAEHYDADFHAVDRLQLFERIRTLTASFDSVQVEARIVAIGAEAPELILAEVNTRNVRGQFENARDMGSPRFQCNK